MKAITYLQNIGAIPQFDIWDLKMAIVVISEELFCEDIDVDPQFSEWALRVKEDPTAFEKRCRLAEYAITSNIAFLYSELETVSDLETLKSFIQELLELRLFIFNVFEGGREDEVLDEAKFLELYNKFVGLDIPEQFSSRTQILRFYYSGALTDIGESILEKLKIPVNKGVKLP